MAVSFRLAEHSIYPGVQVVEVLVGGEVVGAIYPRGDKGIMLVSAHIESKEIEEGFTGEVIEDARRVWPPIPALVITFNPSPYTIRGGKVVKLSSGEG